MKLVKLCLSLLILSQLGACAVMSKSECLSADWKHVGYAVGIDGESRSGAAFTKRQKVCERHGAVADWQRFKAGYRVGIKQYCHVHNSVLLGIQGAHSAVDSGVCPEAEYPGFEQGFYAGYRLHELENRLYNADAEVSRLESRKYDYHRERKRLRKKLKSDDLDPQERRSLEKRCDYIDHSIYELRGEIRHYENKAYRRRDEASEYESFLRLEYPESFSYSYQPPI